ncbi:hypothetical protein OIE66_23130 [Nonomuraea sp. NBC_01738]|uniref:hypothetical protein n=1 Tax=Nonomuraea sp. NBC_01738 TaxID=2976003 RepID=UPI002E1067A5|nr:hypothetical protein OIE66_23130 [Nonomuraea sp. NBC_01738]
MTLDDDLAVARGRRGLPGATLALAAALLLACGVLLGITAQKSFGGTAGGSGFQARAGAQGAQGSQDGLARQDPGRAVSRTGRPGPPAGPAPASAPACGETSPWAPSRRSTATRSTCGPPTVPRSW